MNQSYHQRETGKEEENQQTVPEMSEVVMHESHPPTLQTGFGLLLKICIISNDGSNEDEMNYISWSQESTGITKRPSIKI